MNRYQPRVLSCYSISTFWEPMVELLAKIRVFPSTWKFLAAFLNQSNLSSWIWLFGLYEQCYLRPSFTTRNLHLVDSHKFSPAQHDANFSIQRNNCEPKRWNLSNYREMRKVTVWEALSWVYITEKGFRVNSCFIQSIFSFANQLRKTFNAKSAAEISKMVCYVFSSSLREKHEWCFVFFFLFKNQNACTLRLQLNIWEKLIACDCFKCFHGSLAFLFFLRKVRWPKNTFCARF
mgnify:CR=1 FL=1